MTEPTTVRIRASPATDRRHRRGRGRARRGRPTGFDIRRLIGGLFILYGLILLLLGAVRLPRTSRHKAAGINIDLWTGLGMLVFARADDLLGAEQPTVPEPPETRRRSGPAAGSALGRLPLVSGARMRRPRGGACATRAGPHAARPSP